MGNEVSVQAASFPIVDMQNWAIAIHKSRLWSGFQNPDQIVGLMMLCQSEGLHPMTAVRQYDLINGKPAMKSEAQLAKFYQRGGRVEWIKRDNTECRARFSHPKNCPEGVEVAWTMDDARKAGLADKDTWKKFPRQMLSARVQAEGVQIADPGTALGINNTEEAIDMGHMIANAAAEISANLTGQEAPDSPAAEAPVMEDKDWRRLRADLNKTLQACGTASTLRESCLEFQRAHGGQGIWMALTRHTHNPEETFGMLAQEHQERVKESDERHSPAGHARWRKSLSECTSETFQHFQSAYNQDSRLQTSDNTDALAERGRELGVAEYDNADNADNEDNEIYEATK